MSKAYLILADGSVFEGMAIGARGKTIGETVFTTGMTGYVETLTDPSYFGQIVTQTFPLIGNYGIEREDFESKRSFVSGYVVRELCEGPSNFRCQGDLDSFLKSQGIVGICGIDTRALTKKLRESGVMNGMILSEGESDRLCSEGQIQNFLEEIRAYKIENAVKSVQTIEAKDGIGETSPSNSSNFTFKYSICLLDFGAKANIQRELEKRGCKVTRVPYDCSAEKIIAMKPDGIMLSNGPGDPAENTGVIEEIRKLCEWNRETLRQGQEKGCAIPIFGICLGHQMLSLARGAKTCRLKYGHRGGNHPVKDLKSGRVYITSQNHGYAVESASLPDFARETFVNLNDGTCEGVEYTDIPAFSVQFHPEACGGPHDTNFLFDRFLEMVKNATE
ncbi:carbamoyl phosphate synthase small subunit [uncultured Treponema sp.]|uniref:carbamoyl phosphate synthase small subunit n=2 Tax=Treponema TaxID=157 RepID=UPI00260F1E68|nr:carbamoyl phosphate synthase small subunit [uncultured Treponema sp.]